MNLIKKIYTRVYLKTNSNRYISYLRKSGIKIGDNCVFRGPNSTEIDLSRPSLIEIGNYVDMNLNFTILTHDYVTSVFLRKYKDFINSSGKVKIGNNIYFGKNCTILKGTTIGDNCIIGAGSLITKNIPENSVAAGMPAKVICSLDEYYKKRKKESLEEAFEYARSIKERYGRDPVEKDFKEEFSFFINGRDAGQFTSIPIKMQLMEAYNEWQEKHNAPFKDLKSFLVAANIH